jgi:predicted RNA-binding Zn-ribbon protein involved in translation (DUF1610 family)
MTKFCFSCGHKLEYKFNPPNFCPVCGTQINASLNTKSSIKTKETQNKKVSVDKEGYTDSDNVPRINKLEYELEDFGASAQQTIGSIFGKTAPGVRKTNVKNINDL